MSPGCVCKWAHVCALSLHQCFQGAETRVGVRGAMFSGSHLCLACFCQQVKITTCLRFCEDPWENLCHSTLRTISTVERLTNGRLSMRCQTQTQLSRIQIWKTSYLTTENFPWKIAMECVVPENVLACPDSRKVRTHWLLAQLGSEQISTYTPLPYQFSVLSFYSLFPSLRPSLDESLMN